MSTTVFRALRPAKLAKCRMFGLRIASFSTFSARTRVAHLPTAAVVASAAALGFQLQYSSAGEKLPANQPSGPNAPHQVVIVGSGPAAHTAAIYCARANLQPVLYEGFMAGGIAPGGQLTTTTDVENFPGFPAGISGPKLMDLFRSQSLNLGTQIFTLTVSGLKIVESDRINGRVFELCVGDSDNEEFHKIYTRSVIIATGATARRMKLPGEETYWQRGISACAVCDGAVPIFRNKPLVVVGGGDSAAEEATFLTKYGSIVYLLVRKDKMRASKTMQDRVLKNPKIKVLWNTEPIEAKGDGNLLKELVIRNTKSSEEKSLVVSGLFYAIGHEPNTKWITSESGVDLDSDGYVMVTPGTSRTNIPGLFAAGDVQDKRYRQAVTAAGSGCMAALDCERWLEE
ncbi:thioredoxin-disulfide reductase, partial [Nowakowskiella sp. JEL0078]